MTMLPLPVNSADIDAAARVLAPFAVRTPLLSPPVLSDRVGAKVFLKPEVLQRTGSFKFRGAFNKLSSIPMSARGGGVVAFLLRQPRPGRGGGSPNPQHAGDHRDARRRAALQARTHQGLWRGGRAIRSRPRGSGSDCPRHCRQARRDAGAPYDDPMVIAGQGTVGREIAEDMTALGITPDIVVAPVSGGGLIAGVATAVKARFPQAMLMSAEPEAFDDHARSCAGKREAHSSNGRTICDALMASIPGEITFAINSRLLTKGLTASDAEVGTAVGFAFRELKLVVEPGGAVGLAALLAGRIDISGKMS